ncbi:MAG: ribonuclease HII [Flavobacteriaceae bacterium]|nr:MAG: ribonuclease HII [Flavobacteriaceae bacterium]
MELFANNKAQLEVGVDEAGRGCLAGPVVAAAAILPKDFILEGLDDSKKLTERQRETFEIQIKEKALAYGIGFAWPDEIDQINILNASFLAMHRALEEISLSFDFIAVDGNRFKPYKDILHGCFIKGDAKFLSIAAASVLAKTARDRYMVELSKDYPNYLWQQNKGYPTQKHRELIGLHGSCQMHRKSFRLLKQL